jgi:hypothetical protein
MHSLLRMSDAAYPIQGLSAPITTLERMIQRDHLLFLHCTRKIGKLVVSGGLKSGTLSLFLADVRARLHMSLRQLDRRMQSSAVLNASDPFVKRRRRGNMKLSPPPVS